MVIFHSYVSLPEGISLALAAGSQFLHAACQVLSQHRNGTRLSHVASEQSLDFVYSNYGDKPMLYLPRQICRIETPRSLRHQDQDSMHILKCGCLTASL